MGNLRKKEFHGKKINGSLILGVLNQQKRQGIQIQYLVLFFFPCALFSLPPNRGLLTAIFSVSTEFNS